MKKKIAKLMTAVLLTVLSTSFVQAETGFSDVKSDNKYLTGINYCVDNGIIRRTAVGKFSPDGIMNRELLAYTLYRLDGSPAVQSDVSFEDVEKGRWFQMGVLWAADNKILLGYGDKRFGVNDGLTEEQFFTALWRYSGSPESEKKASYDSENISDWAKTAVSWAAENALFDNEKEKFDPKSYVTRGMASDIFMKFLEIKETPYMELLSENSMTEPEQAEFIEKIKLTIEGQEGEAIVSLTDSKPTREFIAQLPMTVDFSDFGDREKFGKIPTPISEDEALLSGYETGDFSYGTPYDCLIMFYSQDNEIIDGIIKLGTFEKGMEMFSGKENIKVTIEAVK